MPYPAEDILTFTPFTARYYDNAGNIQTFGTTNRVKKTNIHDATGNAGVIKGFKLCRPWNRQWGEYRLIADSYGGYKRTITGSTITYNYRPLSGLDAWESSGGVYINAPPPLQLASSNMINATLVKALNKLKSGDVHFGNFVGEGHKTLEMVGNTAKGIAKQVTAFRGKYPKDWLQVVATQLGGLKREGWHTIPNAWLALQYGWKPLMSDVFGAIMHLYRRSRFDFPYARGTGYNFTVSEVKTSINIGTGPCFDAGNSKTQDVIFQDKQECWVKLTYGLSSPLLAELSALGLLNPADVLWETTRYSFVVDWFLPIGNWLSALSAPAGYSFITGCQSRKTTRKFLSTNRTGTWPGSIVPFPGTTWQYSYPGDLSIRSSMGWFSRSCYASSPVPGLYVKNPISFAHVANGLSLLAQAFK